jgi:hypothetical protein
MKKSIFTAIASVALYSGLMAQTNTFPNGLVALRGTNNTGSALLRGSAIDCHFHFDTNEDTYIRGGKSSSRVIIGDIGSGNGIFIGAPGITTNVSGLLQVQNGLLSFKGGAVSGAATLAGSQIASHFSFAAGEDTYIRGGLPSSNVYIGDLGNAVIVGSVSSLPAGYKLYVGTGILTERVRVAVSGSGNWADHVFAPGYQLAPLSEVETFIKANRHLPGVPSAETMVKEGLDVAAMDAKLLEKIEELTLYIIDTNKRMDKLEKENAALKQQNIK